VLTNLEALRVMDRQLDRVGDPVASAAIARALLRAVLTPDPAERPASIDRARRLLRGALPAEDGARG
jgi:hypothetical protein